MKLGNPIFIALWTLVLTSNAHAADVPRQSTNDSRVRYVTYKPDDVVVISVRRGVVTRVILQADERITGAGTGFAAQCNKDELEWCIRADNDTNQVWVKPRTKATHNNLELATSKRDYSFRFEVLPDRKLTSATTDANEDMYRVIFQYPVPAIPFPAALLANSPSAAPTPAASQPITSDEKTAVNQRLAAAPVARNPRYSMEAIGGGEAIAPSLAFDDGRFTYFQFANNREIPAPFFIAADHQEARVNFHMEGDLMVIHRTAPRFVLRLGDAVVGIWNDAYDPDGVGTPKGTVVPSVTREVK